MTASTQHATQTCRLVDVEPHTVDSGGLVELLQYVASLVSADIAAVECDVSTVSEQFVGGCEEVVEFGGVRVEPVPVGLQVAGES